MAEIQKDKRFEWIVKKIDSLPYWNLCVAWRPAFQIANRAGDELTEKNIREKQRWFITRAFE